MRFIGLDVSYRNVGVVILDHADTVLRCEHLKCDASRYPDGFTWHREHADQMFAPGDVVSLEGLSFGSVGKTHMLQGAHAYWIERAVAMTDLVILPVPMRVKLWAVGSVKASKADMKAWARNELNVKKISEHEADALSLAQMARAAHVMRACGPGESKLTDQRIKLFHNDKNNGLLQTEDLAFFRGMNGKG